MGLINSIASAIKDKARDEVLDYIKQIMEDEKKKEEGKEKEKEPVTAEKKEKVEPQPKQEEKLQKEATPVEEVSEPREEKWIPPVIDEEIEKITLKKSTSEITIPKDFTRDLQDLDLLEFGLYMKLYVHSISQKKNYGYLGTTLKKKIGLEEISSAEFTLAMERLEKRGVLYIEDISENQKTFVLYMPFDEESMKKVSTQKKKSSTAPKKSAGNQKTKKSGGKGKKSGQGLPGQAVEGMDDDALVKSYMTYVSLEIDKAKMRVGRSNFDKIYMEAVKYIDKKYGFQVLSDSEKFKEYLTQYYISAFDISNFDEWKKTKA
jgi:hypothetical protein